MLPARTAVAATRNASKMISVSLGFSKVASGGFVELKDVEEGTGDAEREG